MTSKKVIWPKIIIVALSLVILSSVSIAAKTKILAVPEVVQQQNQWCWAGVSDAVLSYFNKDIEQCRMANFAWSRTDCCTNPTSANCNQPNSMYGTSGSLKEILNRWCVKSRSKASALGFSKVKYQINRNRPIVIRYAWDSGGGHFILIRGYSTDGPKYLYLMNPWPGDGYGVFTYDSVKRTVGDHTWTHTLTNVKRNKTQGNWIVNRSSPVWQGSYWTYYLYLSENRGGCGTVEAFYWDFYDERNNYLSTQTNTGADFAAWFDECSDGDDVLPRKATVCGDLWVDLGGRTSGYVRHRFRIKCDNGTRITEKKKFYFSSGAGSLAGAPQAIEIQEDGAAGGPIE